MTIAQVQLPSGHSAEWISESGEPTPGELHIVDDSLRASDAAQRLKSGEFLLWTGDYHNGRQLLKAIRKRVNPRVDRSPATPLEQWTHQRATTSWRAAVIGRLLVCIDPDASLPLRRAPDTRQAVEWAWGSSNRHRLVPLTTLIGALGAAGWRREGLTVEGLQGRLFPHYGVFAPTRQAYVTLLDGMGDVTGQRMLDVGCGTGVLSFVLLQRGLAEAVGTDIDTRAVACANANAAHLGLDTRFRAQQADLFVQGQRFDWVLFNAPWMVGEPATRLDRAVFDRDGETLRRWLMGLDAVLQPQGRGALIVSDLAERLGQRAPDALQRQIEAAGLQTLKMTSSAATHGRAKKGKDPLHQMRSSEKIRLFVLGRHSGV